ncbi:hypothetical protein E1162_04395 [Rhodobacteraceae bacterium RKSG542]|uniref:ATP-binding protein n=1 Tax=Pseudovibrio flavus TaxID=2529854 RepID=UPI0012BC0CD9|nr:ATP-binding protein [Pseudovibrio flavus]MTI16478.1 hypothetical protein [Pseudovibrio flavus]
MLKRYMRRIEAARSIRLRLLMVLIPVLVVVWAVASLIVYIFAYFVFMDTMQEQMLRMATVAADVHQSTIARPKWDGTDDDDVDEKHELKRKDDYVVVIRDSDGNTLHQSHSTLHFPNDLPYGRSEVTVANRSWLVLHMKAEDGARSFIIASRENEVDEVIRSLAASAALPLFLVFSLSLITVVWLVGSGLKPLNQLSSALNGRKPDQLEAIEEQGQVKELLPIVKALNALFARIRRFMDRERRFIDDAAHELRTPLTVVKAQCQAIDETRLDDVTKQRIGHILTGVDRANAICNQLLAQARAEQPNAAMNDVDLKPLLFGLVGEMDALAQQRGCELSAENVETVPTAYVSQSDLWMILRNILENAIRFAGDGGEVQLSCQLVNGQTVIAVEDSGPGIDKSERGKVFERFYSTNVSEGAGLGLSIVNALANRNRLDVVVCDPLHLTGARFELHFPR